MLIIELYSLYYQYLEYLASIDQIKIKFHFRKDFDFDDWNDWLRGMKSWSDLYKEHEDLNIIRKMEDQFKKMVSTASDLVGLIDNFLKHRDEFSRKINPFKDEALYHSPKTGLTHEELHNFLGEFKSLWKNSLDSLPEIGKGRPSNTHNKRCVNLLVMMFINGSELKPS